MIHWDPSQKFHFDLKYVKIPFLAGRAHCFGKECRTYLVFRILWCWLTSEDSKCVLIICRIRACCNIWNSTPLCFLYLQNTPLFPSFATTTQKTSKVTFSVFCNSHGHGHYRRSLGIGERERGRLVPVHMQPSCQVEEALSVLQADGAPARVRDLGSKEWIPFCHLSGEPLCRAQPHGPWNSKEFGVK